jgi:dTDP-4-dehydrorhamnose reductase
MLGRQAKEQFPYLGWEPLMVNITDRTEVEAAIENTEAPVVVNVAAYTDVSGARQQSGETDGPCYRINVGGVRNLVHACAKAGKHFVQVSTDYVFEGDREDAYLETDDGDARTDWYGISKKHAEDLVKQSGGGWAIVRVSFPYLRHSDRKTDLVRRIVEQLRTGAVPPMFNDQIITPTFGDDAVGILAQVARTRAQGVFHAVGPEWLSPHQVAVRVAERLGLDATAVPSSSLQDYVDKGARPFPKTLRMGNGATLSALHQPARTLSDALLLPGWTF